jgi:Ca2+-binding RTX toxin-like protein
MAIIQGDNRDNTLVGTTSTEIDGNSIYGLGGNDHLIGLAGPDLLDGGTGKDLMEGGGGSDIYYVDNRGDRVIEQVDAGFEEIIYTTVSYTLPDNVEYMMLAGTGNINGTGNSLFNVLSGNIGDNKLYGLDGADWLSGDTGPLDAGALAGNARGGNDYLDGGTGGNLVWGDAPLMDGNARGGNDRLFGGGRLIGDALYDMNGNARGGNDRLEGEAGFGDATFMAGHTRGGNDQLYGGGFNGDSYGMFDNAQGGDDYLFGTVSNDRLVGDAYEMSGNARGGNDRLIGRAGNDILHGDALQMHNNSHGGNDYLDAGAGDDILYGDAQLMIEFAQGGNDRLRGGSGHDTFSFGGGGPDTPDWTFGNDVILVKISLRLKGLALFRASMIFRSTGTVATL